MNLVNYLKSNEQEILNKWEKSIVDSYPLDSGKFLLGNKNQFANPIGYTLHQELPRIYNGLVNEDFNESFKLAIENIIKIRSVQKYEPFEAVNIFKHLKSIIYDLISTQQINTDIKEYIIISEIIDKALSLSFEAYLKMKIKLMEIKLDESKRSNQKMLQRLTKKYGMSDEI